MVPDMAPVKGHEVSDLPRGVRIREARLLLGLSQAAFAESAGVSKRAQIRYEQGEPPTADYLSAIDKLGVDVSVVLTGKTIEERRSELEDRLGAITVASDRSRALTADLQKGELIRDILLADRWGKAEIADAAIERYVAVRQVKPKRSAK